MRFVWIALGAVVILGGFGVFLLFHPDLRADEARDSLSFVNIGAIEEERKGFFSFFSIEPPQRQYSYLDGVEFAPEDSRREYAIAVMIDNAGPARRGQIGLEKASLVVEALAEGGVTRFLAIFSSRDTLEKIGPVRSARPYFFDFVKPLHGFYVHAGGSDAVMAEFATQDTIFNIDHGGATGEIFTRDQNYLAPHNLFTSSEKLIAEFESRENKQGFEYLGGEIFNFSDVLLHSAEAVQNITINFSQDRYAASWQWNEEKEVFERIQSDGPKDIAVKNLIVMEAEMWPIPNDPKGRLEMKTTGSGDVLFFQNGTLTRGTWQKASRKAELEFLNSNGLPLTFLRGKTWIAIVDDMQKVSFE